MAPRGSIRTSHSRPPSFGGTESIFHHDDDEMSSDLDAFSSLDGSQRGRGNVSKGKNKKEPRSSTQDAKAITNAKLAVIIILVVSAISVSVASYAFTRKEEVADFEDVFNTLAQDMLETIDLNARSIQDAFEAFSLGVASLSVLASGSTWPLLTIPNWAAQGDQLARQTGSHQVAFMPKVLETDRVPWEAYSVETFDASEPQIAEQLPADFIWRNESAANATPVPEDRTAPYYFPIWQTRTIEGNASMAIYNMINRNALDMGYMQQAVDAMTTQRVPIQTQVLYTLSKSSAAATVDTPVTAFVTPILESTTQPTPETVGVMVGWLEWQYLFTQLLPEGVASIIVVVGTEKNCQQRFSFQIDGPTVTYMGPGDQHDSDFEDMVVESVFEAWGGVEDCGHYTFAIYPSDDLEDNYKSMLPWIYSGIALMIFAVAGVVFILYDWTVERNKEKIEQRAAKTDAIVNSLFPANVRDRLIRGDEKGKDGDDDGDFGMQQPSNSGQGIGSSHMRTNGDSFGNNLQQDESGVFTTRPIADLFPEATVMFADIVGFTAWSSTREPSQVFTLLETVYNAFDKIANRRKVFKVETIGDCYVAVAGLPEPRKDHAVCMARFSNDCLVRMKEVVQRLERSLGPDTAELSMRFGLHSGPVTAGVLRGEKSRFQLFGDTVNTAARIESTGERDKIHLSSEAAEHLKAFGKGHWIQQRGTLVQAKGKGEIQTYWLVVGQGQHNRVSREERSVSQRSSRGVENSSVVSGDFMHRPIEQIAKKIVDSRMQRLIGWNVDVLKRQLRQILAHRDPNQIAPELATIVDDSVVSKNDSSTKITETSSHDGSASLRGDSLEGFQIMAPEEDETPSKSTTPLEEVQDIIKLPSEPTEPKIDPYMIEIAPEVISQLTDFVTAIAQMYHENPFHNFEHASHVTMSVCKLLSRVVTPQSIDYTKMEVQQATGGEDLHKYTYGITSDPILQFACALSALIHDVDHPGVPNATLVQEHAEMAAMYNNKSCAEQNSLDLAWGLLMEPQYAELRSCIYRNQEEKTRFRQLLVNSVMATDIADRELGAQRKARWTKAFATTATPVSELTEEELLEDSNRKATIVIEHLIQASDVSHTMQHWHVYIKWNEKLFQEMYRAYQDGRSEMDPSINWYKSEIGFFDFYLIPLAKKLKECGVFGVSSDEYLSYVQANRKEWELKGEGILTGYLENYKQEFVETMAGQGGTIQEE